MEVGVVVVWWLVVAGLFGAGLPLAAWLLPNASDRGAFLALPIATATVVLPVYWLGQVRYGPLVTLLGVAVLVAASVWARERGHRPDRYRALETLLVFSTAFLFLLAIRSVDPGAHPGGGEKFLDMGILQSLLRSDYLPPADMWFAGKRVAYYYGGHLVAATIAQLTGTAGRYAYNLALVTAYAGAVTSVYGFAGAIADRRGLPRGLAAGLGAFLFGFASNLYTAAGLIGTVLRGGLLEHVASATGRTIEQTRVTIESFSYWWASRIIPGVITEFPLFAYLNGDLHAHMTDTTILLLVAGVGYAYYRTNPARRWRRRLLVFGVAPPAIGFLTVVNTWSLPTGIGLLWLSLMFADASPASLCGFSETEIGADNSFAEESQRLFLGTGVAVLLVPLSLLWVGPYVENVLLVGNSVKGVALVTEQTGFWALVIAHGGFLLAFAWYLAGFGTGSAGRLLATATLVGIAGLFAAAFSAPVIATVVPLAVGAWLLHRRRQRAGASGLPGFEAVLLVAGAGLVTLVEFVYLNDAASGGRFNTVFKIYAQVWPLWAVAGGVALTAALARGRTKATGLLGRRSRLVLGAAVLASLSVYGCLALLEHFHPYTRVWFELGPEAILGVGLSALLAVLILRVLPRDTDRDFLGRGIQTAGTGLRAHPVLAVALALTLVLNAGIAATAGDAAVPESEPTIDALQFVHIWHSGEAGAIEWLLERSGTPHLVSAPGLVAYSWVSEASSLTGVPTVLGWVHEANYRSQAVFERRLGHVDTIFRGTPGQRATLLRRYDVRYIYVGPNERERYGRSDLDFADEPGISVAGEWSAVTIYRVNRSALLGGPDSMRIRNRTARMRPRIPVRRPYRRLS